MFTRTSVCAQGTLEECKWQSLVDIEIQLGTKGK